MKTSVVQILIRRSLTSEPSDIVLAHEVPILKVIRGAGSVTVTDADCSDCELQPPVVTPRDELIRLKQKYRGFTVDGQNPVDAAYPDGSRDLELFYKDPSVFDKVGETEGGGIIGDDPEEETGIVDDEGNEVPALPTPPEADTGTNLNDRPAVMAALDKAGVPYAKTTATKHLATLLTNSLEQGASD